MKKLFSRIAKAFRGLLCGFAWIKSTTLTVDMRYDEAIDLLKKIENDMQFPAEGQLLLGTIYYLTNKKMDSIAHYKKAIDIINKSKVYKTSEKQYLISFASVNINHAINDIGFSGENTIKINLENIDLKKIRKNFKRVFPLRDHPDWVEQT